MDTGTWYSPSDCIWTGDDIQLPSKFSIAENYSALESFFCNILGITAPKLDEHIKGLKEVVESSPSVERIKQMITNICQFNPTPKDLKPLLDCKCFPVTMPTGVVVWMDSKDNFAIVDRREYGRLFKKKINLLEFTLEEVHSFQIFLHGLRLRTQYISGLADADTTATDSIIDEQLTAALRRKAYAICR
jgi:hypothetical protein